MLAAFCLPLSAFAIVELFMRQHTRCPSISGCPLRFGRACLSLPLSPSAQDVWRSASVSGSAGRPPRSQGGAPSSRTGPL